ncbi:MAG: DoxX family protein [Candidatus Kapaibacteriota bacterium]
MKYIPLIGRILFTLLFIMSGFGHIFNNSQMVAMAEQSGVPLASIAVPVTGIMILLGGLSILLGYQVKIGSLLILIFLIPTSFIMHSFWSMTDPMMSQLNMVMFMKNMGLAGASLIFFYFGTGPLSLDQKQKKL